MPARRARPSEPYRRPRLQKSPEEAATALKARIEVGRELAQTVNPAFNPAMVLAGTIMGNQGIDEIKKRVARWSDFNSELLRSLFDTDEVATDYEFYIGIGIGSTYDGPAVILDRLHESIDDRVSRLLGIVEKIEAGLYELAGASFPIPSSPSRDGASPRRPSNPPVINIYGGTVGTLNTGEVLGNIHSHVSSLTGSPSAVAFRESIEAFSKTVAEVDDLTDPVRTEVLENIEFIAESGAQPPDKRRVGVLRAALTMLPDTLALSSRALEAWDKYSGAIRLHLGL
jgi:hypothetical protein